MTSAAANVISVPSVIAGVLCIVLCWVVRFWSLYPFSIVFVIRATVIFTVYSRDSRLLICPFIPLMLMLSVVISLFFLILFLSFNHLFFVGGVSGGFSSLPASTGLCLVLSRMRLSSLETSCVWIGLVLCSLFQRWFRGSFTWLLFPPGAGCHMFVLGS